MTDSEAKETYPDGYVAAVPTQNREKFIEHSNAAAVIFREHACLDQMVAGIEDGTIC
ncbi:MAG: DUF1428 family protein [Myxococcota bacterium]